MAGELSAQDRDWRGRFSAGDNSVPLQDLRVTTNSVHFELPGEGTFEGAVAGDSMAGSISGGATGSFARERHPGDAPRTILLLGPWAFGPGGYHGARGDPVTAPAPCNTPERG